MNKYRNIKGVVLVFFILEIILISACNPSQPQSATDRMPVVYSVSSDSVVVLYLHQKRGCITCKAIAKAINRGAGRYSNRKVVFRDLLIGSDEGKHLAALFKVNYAGVVIYRNDSITTYYKNITPDAFLLATTHPDSLDRLIDRSIESYQ